jgi:hypothetical protein
MVLDRSATQHLAVVFAAPFGTDEAAATAELCATSGMSARITASEKSAAAAGASDLRSATSPP